MIMQGLPASGKSTFVKNIMYARYRTTFSNFVTTPNKRTIQYVSSDEVRSNCLPYGMHHESEINDEGFQQLVNHQVWEKVHEMITLFLMSNNDVILDATNLQRQWWQEYSKYRSDKVDLVGIQINSLLCDVIERDAKRKRVVGKEIIENMERNLEPMEKYPDDFDKLIIINHP